MCLLLSVSAASAQAGAFSVAGFAGLPPGSYGADVELGIADLFSLIGTVQQWESETGCLLESLICSRGGLSLGGGVVLTVPVADPFAIFFQLEGGNHSYARADVSGSYWAVRGGFLWSIVDRLATGIAVKRQTLGSVEYLEGPFSFRRRVSAGSLTAAHVMIRVRIH